MERPVAFAFVFRTSAPGLEKSETAPMFVAFMGGTLKVMEQMK